MIQRHPDHSQNALSILHHVFVSETQHPVSLILHGAITRGIFLLAHIMRGTVQFDNQSLLSASKVRVIAPDLKLLGEMMPVKLATAEI